MQADTRLPLPLISVVSPVYGAEEIVTELITQLSVVLSSITEDYEIILVEDGSPDHSWKQIKDYSDRDIRIKGIRLSRNFGQHRAISAGLEFATGQYVVVMDCDLQDDPSYIPQMLQLAYDGGDIIFTYKSRRRHPALKNLLASLWHFFFNRLVDDKTARGNKAVGAYSLLSRRVVDAYCQIKDYHRHYLSVLRWLGFEVAFLEVAHSPRFSGHSSYTFMKLLRHAIDGIASQSTRLLYISIAAGIFFCLSSFVSILILVCLYYFQGFREGWASLACLLLLSTGVILMSLGIVGLYIGKIFEQVRELPLFLVRETVNYSGAWRNHAHFECQQNPGINNIQTDLNSHGDR